MKAAIPLVSLALCAATFAAVPVEWTADIDHPAPAQFAVMRGEAVRLRAGLVRGGALYDPAAESAALYYQTNGMGSTWWSAPATVSSNVLTADFTAAMDPGAPSVTAFLAASDADGAIYRAFAVLRFLHAPGAAPNEIDLPVRTIDFAKVAVTNAPWALPSDVSESDPLFSAWLDANTNAQGRVAVAGALADWSGQAVDYVTLSRRFVQEVSEGVARATNYTDEAVAAIEFPDEADPVASAWLDANTNDLGIVSGAVQARYAVEAGKADSLFGSGRTASSEEVFAAMDAAVAAGPAATNYADSAIADALDASRVYTTNYYALSSLGRISIDTNGVLAVDVRDAATNDWSRAWDSADVASALDANTRTMAQVETTLGTAVAAWADFDAQGHPNPDPDLITLNRAYTAIASGFFWASSGGYYCLCAEGTVAYLAEAEGSFRIFGQSVSNYFGLVAGGTVTVGADASAFRVANGTASITYPYTGGDHPTVYGAATLAGPWTEMSSAVWVDDASAGTATASFPADQTSFFFKATTTRQLSEYFHATVPSYLEGGIKTAFDDLAPVVYDSKITIQSGGHTYRIPAQLVQ